MVTLRQKSQITIPKQIRKELGLKPGDEVEFETEEGKVIVQKKSSTSVEKSAPHKQTRYIPASIKNQIRLQSKNQCEFVGHDGNKCESKTGLEFDHKEAYALGGTNEISNIRHLCKTHNLHYAIKTFGFQKMKPYFKNVS